MKYRYEKGNLEHLKNRMKKFQEESEKMWMMMSPARIEELHSPKYKPIKRETSQESDED